MGWTTKLAWLLLALASLPSQAYPEKPVVLVVPTAAGGAADVLARDVAEALSERLGQRFVVENLAGSSGALAARRVMRSAADGYTLLLATTSELLLTPATNPRAGYTAQDFTPVALLGLTPMALVARRGLRIDNLDALVERARQQPGALSIGTVGAHSFQAYATLALQQATQTRMHAVPYTAGTTLLKDLLGERVDLALMVLPSVIGAVRAGQLELLGLSSSKRLQAHPDLATLGESRAGQKLEMYMWAGLVGPAGMPSPIVEKLAAAAAALLRNDGFRARAAARGDVGVPAGGPEGFAALVAQETARIQGLVPLAEEDPEKR